MELIGKTGENPAQSHCCMYGVHFLDLNISHWFDWEGENV